MPFIVVLGLLLAGHIFVLLQGRSDRKKTGDGKVREGTRAVAFVLMVLDAVIVVFLTLILALFETRWYMSVLYVLAGLLILWLLIELLFMKNRKKRLLLWLVCALLVGGGLGGVLGWEAYQESITLREEFDYRTYLPFQKDSPVKTLDEPATLRFSEGDALPRMDGATALYPVYAAFCQALYPESIADEDLYDTIKCTKTTWAYQRIVDGKCDIIFVAGPSADQEAYAAEHGVELVYTPIGREAFVFFVHPKNPADGLTLDQLRGVYSGEITRWDQLGVEGLGEILAYQRDEGSGSQTALERFVMGDTPLMTPSKEEVIDGMGGIVEQVSAYQNHRNAIGFSFRFYATALMKGFDVKLLEINGVAPTVENIENGTYPLASSFYAVTRSDADENTLALLDWITGPQGQALIEKTGYTPIAAK